MIFNSYLKLNSKKIFLLFVITSIFLIFLINSNEIYANENEETLELKILSSWGPEYHYVLDFLNPFIEKLNNETDGRIKATWTGPESVPAFEQLQPLRRGLFDMLFTSAAYHMGEIAVGVGMDLVIAEPGEIREAGLYEILNEAYEQVNAKVLGMAYGKAGYHFMLKDKCINKADFTGLKLRTTPSYDPLAKALGASTVQIPAGEIYSSLEKGVVDGAAWPVIGALDYKWYEVADYQLRPQFGQVSEFLLVNLDTWNKIPKDLQDRIIEITIETEDECYKNLTERYLEQEQKLIDLGMELCILPEEEGEKLLQVYYDRSWEEIVLQYAPEFGPRLKKIADEIVSE